ncbi:MAG: bifunctional helix-turn-helix transcriptional regulator/GNAT family N-acetyltransferase [Sphingomonas sp.]|uniref:bifunctional helix-turn-helix transcriptional regulator/GNAT family N-acetyltransferase n=1 Tax=Sphingomonas sp. TaxID=28214 RepID=UPI002272CA00|nr:bifunctional helix-turn-helix transcriptional regulator/GNAT family N-acetyltransferase [Sphingomonas sp.]MCX8477762.1 bifunctional helix-turn-helix transcriptional regulator/GNAT family N-acetyltransferase [Sphingomonas sp.]
MADVLRDLGPAFLGSRLKRLGERMQAGAARITTAAGLPVQPSHMPLLAALDGKALTVGQLVQAVGISQPGITRGIGQLIELGLVQSRQGDDQRQRTISLTPAGIAALERAKLHVWPQVEAAVRTLCGDGMDAFIAQITDAEKVLAATPLDLLATRTKAEALTIREYSDDLAIHFRDINTEWITAMFQLEDADREVLENPRAKIIDGGGAILFVEAPGRGIIGTCALRKSGSGFELTKMAVRETARGLKAGEFLLSATIQRALSMDADPLYLLTNSKCAAAIHLYEKLGFAHDAGIMARYGARYERCDVAMRYRG